MDSKIILLLFQVLHPQSMRPAREGDVPVRVKNSYNPKAPGTLITRTRDMTKVCNGRVLAKLNTTNVLELKILFIFLFSIAGSTNEHCSETECDHVGYC